MSAMAVAILEKQQEAVEPQQEIVNLCLAYHGDEIDMSQFTEGIDRVLTAVYQRGYRHAILDHSPLPEAFAV